MKKKGVIILVVVIVVAAGVWLWVGRGSKSNLSLATTQVTRGSISNSVTATGTVEPVTEVSVGTQVSGIIDHLYVDYNDVVKKGQLIAEMDKVNLQAELESAEAQLANSRTEFEYQQKNYARNKVLYEKGLISDSEYETATYNYEKAKSTYDQSQASMVKVKRNLEYATITSPIDGVVISRAVEEGQTVAAGFETPELFTIAADLTQMQVIADVDEADIGQVEEGQLVTFNVDAYPNDVFEGEVTQVRLEATVESNVVTYEVVISAHNPDLKLKPGLTANVTIYVLKKDNVLTVPAKALRFEPDAAQIAEMGITVEDAVPVRSGQQLVWVRVGDTLRSRAVTLGSSAVGQTEVLDGLSEGEEVVTGVTVHAVAEAAAVEQSPFMPGPPGSKNKDNKAKEE